MDGFHFIGEISWRVWIHYKKTIYAFRKSNAHFNFVSLLKRKMKRYLMAKILWIKERKRVLWGMEYFTSSSIPNHWLKDEKIYELYTTCHGVYICIFPHKNIHLFCDSFKYLKSALDTVDSFKPRKSYCVTVLNFLNECNEILMFIRNQKIDFPNSVRWIKNLRK